MGMPTWGKMILVDFLYAYDVVCLARSNCVFANFFLQ